MIVIVDYGYLNGKYYWVIQNNYGERFCLMGLYRLNFANLVLKMLNNSMNKKLAKKSKSE